MCRIPDVKPERVLSQHRYYRHTTAQVEGCSILRCLCMQVSGYRVVHLLPIALVAFLLGYFL